jgi:hypothetical protein
MVVGTRLKLFFAQNCVFGCCIEKNNKQSEPYSYATRWETQIGLSMFCVLNSIKFVVTVL